MENKFLKKIIIEELQNVLKEVDGVVQGEPQQVTGMATKLTPEEKKQVADLVSKGRALEQDAINMVVAKRTSPIDRGFEQTKLAQLAKDVESRKREATRPGDRIAAIKNIQQKLADLGFLDKKNVIGVFGPRTAAALNAAMQADPRTAISPLEAKSMSISDLNTIAQSLDAGNRRNLQSLAVKYRVQQAVAPVEQEISAGQKPLSGLEEAVKEQLTKILKDL